MTEYICYEGYKENEFNKNHNVVEWKRQYDLMHNRDIFCGGLMMLMLPIGTIFLSLIHFSLLQNGILDFIIGTIITAIPMAIIIFKISDKIFPITNVIDSSN